jgi:cytochrome c oxidase subunit III
VGTVVEIRPHARDELTRSLGMLVFLASWGMMFAGLFFAYGFARSKAIVWPPAGAPPLPLALPALNTVVILASSFSFAQGLSSLRKGLRNRFRALVGVTFALGVLFLVLQLSLWRHVAAAGLGIADGSYGAVFYSFTAFHALHVLVGLGILLWVFVRSLQGAYTEHNTASVRVCAMFWHFVDVVWVLMFLTIYVF